jgi:hypothetical protein
VTGDRDLLELHSYEGIVIYPPGRSRALLEERSWAVIAVPRSLNCVQSGTQRQKGVRGPIRVHQSGTDVTLMVSSRLVGS